MSKKLPKKNKGLFSLSKMSGLSKEVIKDIWKGVKENNALLSSCSFHIFSPHPSPNMSRRFICENCKGIIGATEKIWYEKGIEHNQHKKEI